MTNKINIVEELIKRFKEEPDLVLSWHANIAVSAQDEGLEYEASQRAAASFLSRLTGGEVDSLAIHNSYTTRVIETKIKEDDKNE